MPPVIQSWGPNRGPMAGGTPITILGTGLAEVHHLRLTGSGYSVDPLPSTRISDTMITTTVPPYGGAPAQTSSAVFQAMPATGLVPLVTIGTFNWDASVAGQPQPAPDCVTGAWLTLDDGRSVALEDEFGRWFCSSLDIGYAVREVTNNKPDRSGADDRTKYLGARPVTAAITAVADSGMRPDAVAASFGPFMDPAARPVLHYILDRPGLPERILTLRAADWSWPVTGPYQRDIQLSFVAPDPVAYDAAEKTATSWAYIGQPAGGRTYPLTFFRSYPAGGSSFPTAVLLDAQGDINAWPLFRIYGPLTNAQLIMQQNFPDGSWLMIQMFFRANYIIDAGHWVDVDTLNRTIWRDSDPAQNVLNQVQWNMSTWPFCAPAPAQNIMRVSGTNASGISQVQAFWRDGFLT